MAVATRPKEKPKPRQDDEKRMELTEHLAELRGRIMRVILYVIVGATVCYFYFKPLYAFLFHPMMTANKHGTEVKIAFPIFTSPFFVVLQISIVAGLIVTLPLVIAELYGFIAPALTREEKKPLRYVAPLSIVLFAGGVALAYWVSKFAIEWFISYVSWFGPNAVLYQDPKAYVLFMLKMMGIFGLVFQLPVLLMFLAWVGILRSAVMKRTWRHAIVGISVIGLFVTPSNDVFTMLMMIIPVMGLYVGSIWLVAVIEKRREKKLRG